MKKSPLSVAFDKILLARIFSFTAPYRKKFYIAVFLSVFLAIMAPIRPLLIQLTVNNGISQNANSFFLQGPGAFILELTIIQIFLLLVETAARFFFTYLTASLGQSVVKDLRDKTYSKIIRLPLDKFDTTPIGTLTTRTINDIESVNDVFSDGFIPIIADLLSILSILVYMFYTDWKVTLVCLLPFPVLILATYFFKESVNKSFTKVRNSISNLNAFVQEHLTGIALIQAFAAENREKQKFNAINKEHRDANIKAIFAYSVFFPVVELVSAISLGLLVWWVAKQTAYSSPDHSLNSAGIITSFILCLNLLFRPLRMIADKFNVLQMGLIASERVFKVLDFKDEIQTNHIQDTNGEKAPLAIKGAIEFKKVWFAYRKDEFVLKDISFNVKAGQSIAIVGNTGSGKTTISGLISRLYQIDKGSIIIDENNINNISIDFLRSHIAVVLQDVFLFAGSVLDNLTLRNTQITIEEVEQATKLIGIHDFILTLPGGYHYNVMERGSTLSLGQRQLLSFARAVLFKPSILILDEATSSIDSGTEALIQEAISKIVTGRTSIIIAHRLSTIKKADNIIVLEKGEIAEMGNHEELFAKKGRYFQLCETQFAAGKASIN